MKLASQVTPEKLRGGFYSPDDLVTVCLDRVTQLLKDTTEVRVLEPSAGDGAFIRGLSRHPVGSIITHMSAVEILDSEAVLCESAARVAPFPVDVHHASFLSDTVDMLPTYDAAVGNPPFVRFQFVDAVERRRAEHLAERLGIALKGVSNLWIPILLRALACLRDNGAFAFIVPAEFLTGISASVVRRWILSNTTQLQIDLFPPGAFPDVLQEVVVLSGLRSFAERQNDPISVTDHHGSTRTWSHHGNPSEHTWTRLLLTPGQVSALEEASNLPGCLPLGQVARFTVATVTGANEFFSVDADTIEQYDLKRWTKPLLPRIRNAPGLVFTQDDYQVVVESGAKGSLLDFSERTPDPTRYAGAGKYISLGESDRLHERYKCRIRDPWYRVPVVRPAELLLSKRSHFYPRVVMNEVGAITTDTIYQGKLLEPFSTCGAALTASFHNSLTLLSAEIEGRSFGGGVLELVPSEVARVRVFVADELAQDLGKLDAISRSSDPQKDEALVEETDRRLAKSTEGLTDSLLASLADARLTLQRRRIDRNRAASGGAQE